KVHVIMGGAPHQLVKMGSDEQPILQKKGDNLRIDWGHLYMVAKQSKGGFTDHADLGPQDFVRASKTGDFVRFFDDMIIAGGLLELAKIKERKSTHILLAYDDEYSIVYFGRKMRPYWRRK